jgi:hypothetical protein
MIPLGVTASQALQEGSVSSPVPLSGLLYWLEVDAGVFKGDLGTTPATTDGDLISRWFNKGSAGDVVQSVEGNRPILQDELFGFETWGKVIFGNPTNETHFEDLAFSQPSGDGYNPWTCMIVQPGGGSGNQRPSILGSGVTDGKMDWNWWTHVSVPTPGQTYLTGVHAAEPDFIWADPGIWAARVEIVDSGPSVHRNLRFNGTQVSDQTSAPGSSSAVAATQFLRNSALDPIGYYNRGLVAFLFWDRYLSDVEIAGAEAFFATKYPIA